MKKSKVKVPVLEKPGIKQCSSILDTKSGPCSDCLKKYTSTADDENPSMMARDSKYDEYKRCGIAVNPPIVVDSEVDVV
jgi:hypothetical protein